MLNEREFRLITCRVGNRTNVLTSQDFLHEAPSIEGEFAPLQSGTTVQNMSFDKYEVALSYWASSLKFMKTITPDSVIYLYFYVTIY